MSAAEAPKSEQIQANVAAALSRLRGELGAASSPVAGTAHNPVPKTPSETGDSMLGEPTLGGPMLGGPMLGGPGLGGTAFGSPNLGPLPAGPVRMAEPERPMTGIRPFEPTLGTALGAPAGTPAAMPGNDDAPLSAAPALDATEEPVKSDLFARMRHEPVLKAERDPSASEAQPDLLSGMEVPPAPPPPLGSFATEDEVTGRGKRMRNRLLVLLVLVLVLGGGAWAYLSQHRVAEGPVPVITADATPEKVKPADEGGMQVPNQNVQILDNMNGQSAEQGQANVLPAPEQPVAPPAADASADQTPAVSEGAASSPNAPAAVDQPAAPSVSAPAIPSVSAPEPGQAASGAPEPAPVAQQAAPEPSAPTEAPKAAEPAKAAEAPAPAPEPAKTEQPAQTAAAPAAPASTPAPSAAGGGIRVQLAAVKSEAAAKAQWAKLQKAHPELLGGLSLTVQTIDKAGVTYYRIQAGPLASKAAAKTLCTKLAAQKQDCIVAK